MMNSHTRSVNVDRLTLLAQLHTNLQAHRLEYAEALIEFKQRLETDLKAAVKKVAKAEDAEALKNFRFNIIFPENHEQDYLDAIEMLEWSSDKTINLDQSMFKQYVKNEWHWKRGFDLAKMSYATAGSFLE